MLDKDCTATVEDLINLIGVTSAIGYAGMIVRSLESGDIPIPDEFQGSADEFINAAKKLRDDGEGYFRKWVEDHSE